MTHYFDRSTDLALLSIGPDVTALQNDLFAFGVYSAPPTGEFDQGTDAAVQLFQQVCGTPDRIVGYARSVDASHAAAIPITGTIDAATREQIRRWKLAGWRWQTPKSDYMERRVRVANYGMLPRDSPLLVDVPGTKGKPRKLHCLAAVDLRAMVVACQAAINVELLVQSGWRRHRWSSRAQYEAKMIERFGSLSKGRKFVAFDSPHETGLAVDFGSGGLVASSSSIDKQRATPVHAWLVANAYRFGFTPYKAEPWHWEHPLSRRAWSTGVSDFEPSAGE